MGASFGSDPGVLGKKIILNGVPYEIVGVMPRSFSLPREVMPTLDGAEQAEILLPLPLPANAAQNRDHEDYNIMGKLKPGVSVQKAQGEMDTITARLRQEFPEAYPPNGGLTFGIVPLLEQVVGNVRRTLYLLLGAVGFVLLIACLNLANLQLSCAIARQKEIAVRTALGASRVRIVRQLLTESVLLAFTGGALGIGLAFLALRGVRLLGPQSVPRMNDVGIGVAALAFTLMICILSSILFGLAPALRASRVMCKPHCRTPVALRRASARSGGEAQFSPLAGDHRNCALRDAVDWRRLADSQLCSCARSKSWL